MSPKGDPRHGAHRRGTGDNEDIAEFVREVVGPEERAERVEPALKTTREASERLFRGRGTS
jgi:hypothetical protein